MEQKNGTRIPNFITSHFVPASTISDSGETWQAISGTNMGGKRCDDCANTSFCCGTKIERAFQILKTTFCIRFNYVWARWMLTDIVGANLGNNKSAMTVRSALLFWNWKMEHVFQILEHLILRRIKAFLSQVKHNGHFGERFGWQKVPWQWGTLQAVVETKESTFQFFGK